MYALTITQGRLTIRPSHAGGCELWIDDQRIHQCASASEAAAVVAQRCTGHQAVDHDGIAYPQDIDGWRWVSLFDRKRLFSIVN
jgi:hypothetical protein